MTNLLATFMVTILTTTNDVPRWTTRTWGDGRLGGIMYYVDEASPRAHVVEWQLGKTNGIIRLPTYTGCNPGDDERVRIVQTKRVTRLTFEWNGKPREIVDEDVLSETRTILVRNETWTPR